MMMRTMTRRMFVAHESDDFFVSHIFLIDLVVDDILQIFLVKIFAFLFVIVVQYEDFLQSQPLQHVQEDSPKSTERMRNEDETE